ncbi:BC_2427 family protein [Bacillus mycoides]|uniref:BC_2427 family protein n=1 Tax=Bacillus mycoides TaxID=1405 RepID=UPI003D1B70B2
MNKPWVGKEIWNKVYKWKMLNGQDDSSKIREKKNSEETESKKEDTAIKSEKERKETESKKEEEAIELEKESEETKSKKEEVIELEKESEETESEKEGIAIKSEKKRKETESKKEEEAIELEKESEETESKKEEEAIELEKESEETKSETEGIAIELEKESIDSGSKIETSVRSIIVKTPFSIISDVTSFIKFPNINVKKQEAFVFRNEKDARGRELDAKLLTTVQHYHGEVNCNLVSSNLHEKRVLLEFSNQKVKGNMEENWIGTSSWIPIHGIILEKEEEADVNNYITGKLPIEIGRYKGEISLQEKVVFKEKVIGIREVSQEIILTKKEFLLPKIIKKGHNPSIIEKGSLFVEGYIFQCIEFISEQSTSHDKLYQLMQNIVLELTIQLLQEQEVRVRIT